jgi:hypothetical protein
MIRKLAHTMRDLSARASNPNIDAQSRQTAKRTLTALRDRFDDETVTEEIDYSLMGQRPVGWAIRRDDYEGTQELDRFAVAPVAFDMLPAGE